MSAYKEKKRSFFFWFFFGVILPILIVGIISVFILTMAGVDVGGIAKDKLSNVPVISSLITSEEEDHLHRELEKAKEKITTQNDTISDLESEVASLEKIVEDMEMDQKKQKSKENTLTEVEDSSDKDEEIKKVAASFRKMDPEKAAKIVEQLDQTEAKAILSTLSGDVKGDILAEMDAKEAAKLMELMMK